VAYRHAAKRLRMPSTQGLIVRLPKLVTDPAWEVMPVPTTLSIEDFLAAMRLWRWLRRMEGKPAGAPDIGRQRDELKTPMNAATGSGEFRRPVEYGVAHFLAQFPSTSRAEALHLALQALSGRMEPDKVLGCELASEVHTHGYWSQVRRSNGTSYEREEAYFREVLRLTSWRTAYKRLAIGGVLTSFGESERALLRTAIADVGLAEATIIVPAVERFGDWQTRLGWAARECTIALQARVSAALETLPRGITPSPPGERFRRSVLSAMPDIEAMKLVEEFFAVGAKVVGTINSVAIFLAGCRECLPECELQASPRPRRGHPQDRDTLDSGAGFCPRGQIGGAPAC
jgi:hypothetical protein